MARNTESTTIDGVWFEATQLGFKDGRRLFVRLAKVLGPTVAALADKAPSLAALTSGAGILPAVKTALAEVSDEDLEWATDLLAKGARFSTDGGTKRPMLDSANREELFAGRLMLWGQWLWWALTVNFSDFSSALSALSASGREGATPDGSTGSSKS